MIKKKTHIKERESNCFLFFFSSFVVEGGYRQVADVHTDRETVLQTDEQTDGWTDRRVDRQT